MLKININGDVSKHVKEKFIFLYRALLQNYVILTNKIDGIEHILQSGKMLA
jgi:hypothetical protein